MDKNLYHKLLSAKSVDEVISIFKSVGEELSPNKASEIFKEIQNNVRLSDQELDTVSGGWKFPWQDDVNPPAPLFKVGDTVTYSGSRESRYGVDEVSKTRETYIGFCPEWRYRVSHMGEDSSWQWESDLHKEYTGEDL